MIRLTNPAQHYAWGSMTAIPELLGLPATSEPMAESWMGAHASAPSRVISVDGEIGLGTLIAGDPEAALGTDVVARSGTALPYLLKILAAERPLSLQVHPDADQARRGYAAEEAADIPIDAPHRSYRDGNHKPELIYALTPFDALCGFRAPLRAAELLGGLDAPLAKHLHALLTAQPSYEGIRTAFRELLERGTRPTAEEVGEVVAGCATRLAQGSPSPQEDGIVVLLADAYPGDPGVVISLLLNSVKLLPGEAMFVPAGCVHAYLRGMGVEVMASSDNVLRAGLTPKHVDVDELLRTVDYVPAPPVRIAPEVLRGATKVFSAPVDEFELSVTVLDDELLHPLPGCGPRILLCIDGELSISSSADSGGAHRTAEVLPVTLLKGESVFAPSSDGALAARGCGTLVQADVACHQESMKERHV